MFTQVSSTTNNYNQKYKSTRIFPPSFWLGIKQMFLQFYTVHINNLVVIG